MYVHAVLSTLQSEDEEVESVLVPFLQAYVSKLRNSQKRGSPISQVFFQYKAHILTAWSERLLYLHKGLAHMTWQNPAAEYASPFHHVLKAEGV